MSESKILTPLFFLDERCILNFFDNAYDYDWAGVVLWVLSLSVYDLLIAGVSQNYATERGHFLEGLHTYWLQGS